MSNRSYIHVPQKVPMSAQPLHWYLDSQAEGLLDNEALIMYDMNMERSVMTFREFRDWSTFVASSLLDLGLSCGDHVLLIGDSSIRYAVSIMALHRVGANAILLGPGGLTVDKVELLKTLDLKMIIFDPAMKASQLEQLKKGLSDLHRDQTMVTLRDEESSQCVYQGDLHAFESLIDRGKALGVEKLQQAQDQIQPDDPHVVFFTSGSTGAPKLVQCTMHQHAGTLPATMSAHGLLDKDLADKSRDKMYFDRPMAYGGGYGGVIRIVAGNTIVWAPAEMGNTEETSEMIFKILVKEKCATVPLTLSKVQQLISGDFHLKYDLSHVRNVAFSGQRYSFESVRDVLQRLPTVTGLIGYGSVEGGFVFLVAVYKKETLTEENYAKMVALPGNEVKVVDEEGKIVPRGTAGEICVRSPSVMLEYLGNPAKTREVKTPTGWYYMGDIVKMDADGRIEVLARKKEFIKRATVKIFPGEIESVLLKYPSVTQAVVFGVPDQRLYEEICACVVLKDEDPANTKARLAELEAWCAEQWPPGADGLSLKPKYFVPMKRFPSGMTGKTDVQSIRKLALEKLKIKENVV